MSGDRIEALNVELAEERRAREDAQRREDEARAAAEHAEARARAKGEQLGAANGQIEALADEVRELRAQLQIHGANAPEHEARQHLPDSLWTFLRDREGGDRWLDAEPPPRRYLLSDSTAGVLPLGRVGMLVAGGGMGKSWALTQLALAVATGRPWLGTFTVDRPGAVLLALAEEEADEMRRRLYYAAQEMGLSDAERVEALANILPLPLAGVPVALTYGSEEEKPSPDEIDTAFSQALRTRLESSGVEWRLLILDPVSRFAGPDVEIDNAAATRFVQSLERFTNVAGGPTVLVAHHSTKSSRGGESSATAARGSSALTDGIRWQANLDPVTEGQGADAKTVPGLACLRVTKSNYGRYPEPLYLRRVEERHGALRPTAAPLTTPKANGAPKAKGVETHVSGPVRPLPSSFSDPD